MCSLEQDDSRGPAFRFPTANYKDSDSSKSYCFTATVETSVPCPLRAILVLIGNVDLVNNILGNRDGGSLSLTTSPLLQNFKDLITFSEAPLTHSLYFA